MLMAAAGENLPGSKRAKSYRDDTDDFVKWIDDLEGQDWQDPERNLTGAQREYLMKPFDRARVLL